MGAININTILLLDDDPVSLLLNVSILENLKIAQMIIPMEDGHAALNLLQTIPCDLILVDILMPGIDGFDFIKRLQELDLKSESKIVILTAHLNFIEKQRFELIGIEDFLIKPLTEEKIKSLITKLFL